ncbi:hypothetical protein E0Z10_g2683 [Xylaria hypoxylon]|uniref:Myocyte-specific enhancer factor 2d n=1 Tax=Xylaria hypoxylon TaxID=37992 RepID=A0A4Z0Z3G6_9PEZI|nr:hypothetical protein E0Z10_g2683 [Xylaria hypoxylon]
MDIPGYYYDVEKRRYFKVENSKTAPTSAAWSSSSVKRRKLRDEDAETALQHLNLTKSRIRRARVLHEPLTGGFFAREHGAMEDDMQATCFVEGLRQKGCVSVGSPVMQVKRMFIGGYDYKTGMCTVHAVPNETMLLSTYLPRDKNGRLNQRLLTNYRLPGHCYMETLWIEQISDIQYHAPSNCMLVTSRQPFNSLWTFSPKIDDDDKDPLRPRWLLSSGPLRNLATRVEPRHNGYEAHCVAPAPASSSLACTVGTNRGIVQWDRSFMPSALLASPKRDCPGELFHDVFTVDFDPSHGEVMSFGGRPGALFTADTRVPFTTWSHLKLPSTITHLRRLSGGHQVLVAGLQNQLGVYDLRFVRSHRGTGGDGGRIDIDSDGDRSSNSRNRSRNPRHNDFKGRNRNSKGEKWASKGTGKGKGDLLDKSIAQPVIQFEHYRNTAHIDIGFAYNAATGIVAAAHDIPGTVALYSVRTGSRLRVLDFASEGRPNSNKWTSNSSRQSWLERPMLEGERMDLPIIQSLQFQTFPGDHTPTLFVGSDRRGGITAFSFGVDDLGDEA